MHFRNLPLLLLGVATALPAAPFAEPLVCRLDALTAPQRSRQKLLADRLKRAVVERAELPDGYSLTLDLGRLPPDVQGLPFCVVEVAEWVDLESRCCPFLDFGIDVRGGGGIVRLRLTGPEGVKALLAEEFGIKEASRR
ncbi:MAG: hypothetical protein ACM3NW_05785 [Syntrophomonadaceae bacterium]